MRWLQEALRSAASWANRRPRASLALVGLSIVASLLAATRIELRTSNLDLIDPELPTVREFREFAARFGSPNLLTVVLESDDPSALESSVAALEDPLRGVAGVRAVLAGPPRQDLLPGLFARRRILSSDDGRLAMIFVQPSDPDSRIETIEVFVDGVREVVDRELARHPSVRAGLTGLPQYALDDRDFIQRDIERLSLLSIVLVAGVFLVAFRSFRRPLAAVAALVVGVSWSLGVVAFVPGHLTLLSAFFASILCGLGIDAGIHIMDRIEELGARGVPERQAVVRATHDLAASLGTSTLTTASVFLLLRFSGFRGFAELGVIAGIGMPLCLVATVVVLPAILRLWPERSGSPSRSRRRLGRVLTALPRPTVAVPVAAACLALTLGSRPVFNGNYTDLQPADSETVRLERQMVERSDFSTQFATLTLDSRDQLREVLAALVDLETVGAVRSLADLGAFSPMGDLSLTMDAAFVAPFQDAEGRLAVYVHPRGDLWDRAEQDAFLADLSTLGVPISGMPVLGRFMVERSWRAMKITALLGIAVLPLWLLWDLRRPALAAIAALPTAATVCALPGLIQIAGLELNPISVMALPIVIGIAVDDGVHLVHRFVAERGDLARTLRGTGRSVLLTSATTVAAFATIALARHRGLSSFAMILVLGVLLALALSLTLLPALLRLLARRRPDLVGL